MKRLFASVLIVTSVMAASAQAAPTTITGPTWDYAATYSKWFSYWQDYFTERSIISSILLGVGIPFVTPEPVQDFSKAFGAAFFQFGSPVAVEVFAYTPAGINTPQAASFNLPEDITAVAVPGPVAGEGFAALMAFAGYAAWRRRRAAA